MPEIALHQYESEIDHLIEEARYLEALAHTRHILQRHPRYIGAYYLLGKTLLEADQPELAIDMFQRALNADPEHLMARIGLMLAHQRVDNLDAAIWNLERAIELNPGDADLIDELRQLYGRRDGVEPERVPLNRAGLARLYMRGNRPARAVEELRALLAEQPQRLDLRLALAEAYWRDDQIVQAADTCQALLDDARYCLKANLLLGALWIDSGQEEGQTYLQRAQEIDLENTLANALFGAASPLKPREVSLDHLTYKLDTLNVDRQAKWFQKLEAASVSISLAALQPEMTATEARLVDITAGLEAQIEIPDWLRELGDEEDGALSWMADIGAEAEAGAPAAEPVAAAQLPDWLSAAEVAESASAEAAPAADIPDWLRAIEPEAAGLEAAADFELEEESAVPEGIPDWLSELEPTRQSKTGAPGAGIPDWLQALEPTAPAAEEIPLPAAGLPDWLSELKRPGEVAETVEFAPLEEGAPLGEDWLQSLQPTAPAEEAVELAEEEALPDWMTGFEGVGEAETLATEAGALPDWLTEFQAAETAEAVIPTEEAAPAAGAFEAELPDWLSEFQPVARPAAEAETVEEDLLDWLGEIPVEETPPEASPPGAEAAARFAEEFAPLSEETPVPESFFGWEAFGEEIAEVEAAPFIEEVSAEGGVESALLSGDDALAWLESLAAGKEEELRAQAKAETQARVAEILGHKPAAKAAPVEAVIEEPAPVRAEAPGVEETFGWEAFGAEMAAGEAPPREIAEGELDWESLAEQLEGGEGEGPVVAPVAEGDDALAWLESLAIGDAEELFAEVEVEAKAAVETEVVEPEPFFAAPVEDMVEDTEAAPVAGSFFGWEAFGEEITEIAAPVAEGDFMSGDAALAWLESLAAGKEEELRAQAEAEAQIRVAEILGHKPEAKPVAPEPVVEAPKIVVEAAPTTEGFFGWEAFGEEIAEAASVEVAAPAIEESVAGAVESVVESDLMSGEDALAWLSSLAAGKEEKLRAQAEAETQARVAEILGRRPEPKVAEPPVAVAPEPVVEKPAEPGGVAVGGVAESVAAEAPVAEGDVMSGDDALAWLSSLAAGKEEELRAQAEAEAQARVAEILGRQVEPARPQVAKPEPSGEEARVKKAGPAEGDLLPGTAALSWLESFAKGREEELRAQAEAEAEVRVAEILGRKPGAKEQPVTPQEPAAPEAPAPVVAAAPVEVVEEEESPEEIGVAPEMGFVGVEPEHAGLLAQARAAWRAGDVDAALVHYNELIQAEAGLDEIIVDLQRAAAEQPNNAALLQTLGDAYMAHGMVDQAIEIFSRAMSVL